MICECKNWKGYGNGDAVFAVFSETVPETGGRTSYKGNKHHQSASEPIIHTHRQLNTHQECLEPDHDIHFQSKDMA